MEFIFAGVLIGIIIAARAGTYTKRTRKPRESITKDEQEIIEQVAIIQPIIQDNHKH